LDRELTLLDSEIFTQNGFKSHTILKRIIQSV